MAIYYFDIAGPVTIKDLEGIELFCELGRVRDEALADARELMSNAVKKGMDISRRRFEIRDETGKVMMTVNFSDALTFEAS